MNYSVSAISSIVSGNITGNSSSTTAIKNLLIDSRKLSNAETSLFFAIKGERHDGHAYLIELYEKGVRHFVVSTLPNTSFVFDGASFIFVNDTLLALQLLCAYHRQQFKIPVVGITGSNRKTIVKRMAVSIDA